MDNEFLYPDDSLVEIAGDTGIGSHGLSEVRGWNQIMSSANPLAELKKALAAGYVTDTGSMVDGGALRIESLEPTLKNLIFTEQSTALFNDLLGAKKNAQSTVEEYSTVDDLGEAFTYEEGGLPASEEDAYSRRFELVKYIGTVGSVTNVLLRNRTLVDAREAEIRRKMLAIKRKGNIVSYFGNSTNVATEFNGLKKAVEAGIASGLVPAENIVNLAGKRLTLEVFNNAVATMENVTGYVTNLRIYLSPQTRNGYKNELLKDKRYLVGGELKAEAEGLKSNELVYDGGLAPMRKDMFLNPRTYPRRNRAGNAFIASGSNPPATPTITSATPGGTGGTIPVGTYDYAVVARNKLGHRSAPQETGGGDVGVTAGQTVTFVLADGGSSSGYEATEFEIFRRDGASTSATDYRYVATFKVGGTMVDDGGNSNDVIVPGSAYAFLVEWDPEQVLAYHQLMDAAIFPLGAVADSPRWLQRLYGTLMVYNPKKIVVFKNIGDTSWT